MLAFIALRSGPLAPVPVTVVTVEARSIAPALYGIGTVEARYTYMIGPTFAGRLKRLDVQVGDSVKAGQVLGEMDPVDLADRATSQDSALKRAKASLREAESRQAYARVQAQRYEQLFAIRSTSEEILATKQQELQIADAVQAVAREDLARARSDRDAVYEQLSNLRLIAPVDGIVAVRAFDPGTTIVAGQAVVELIEPTSLWINVRFDQISASGLVAGLPGRIVLRSRGGQPLEGRVLRLEPKADAVTEELLAKVTFATQPAVIPPIGELAEVTVDLPTLPAAPVIPNAAVRRVGDKIGVWRIVGGDLRFAPIKLGAADLDGNLQVREGIASGDRIVAYSEKALTARSRIHVVEQLAGGSR
ncbi:MAG: efflux RND transporter periplasmic adaptor subunit [Gammaproteobacteria bacterium]|nr:efflux RND transporter periplasmic adaptor subunit [Gammaproteobacteria bacterium]